MNLCNTVALCLHISQLASGVPMSMGSALPWEMSVKLQHVAPQLRCYKISDSKTDHTQRNPIDPFGSQQRLRNIEKPGKEKT